MPFCTKCGANLPETANFCGICGSPVSVPAPQAQQMQQQSRPQQAPANPYRQPASGYGVQYQQPRQAGGYSQYRQQPYQQQYQQPSYMQYQQNYGDNGWDGRREAKPARHLGFLRVLSVLLALGILVAAAGFGSWLYYDRTLDAIFDGMMDESRQNYLEHIDELKEYARQYSENSAYYQNEIDHYQGEIDRLDEVKEKVYKPLKGDIKSLLTAAILQDPGQLKTAVRDVVLRHLENPEKLKTAYDTAASRDNIEAAVAGSQADATASARDFPADAIASFYSENREDITSLIDEFLGGIENAALREPLRKAGETAGEQFGFRWLMLQAGARGTLLMIIGGGLALLSLILWFVFGGVSAGAGRSGLILMAVIALVLAAAMIAACLFLVSPVGYEEINEVVAAEKANSESWGKAVSALVGQAVKTWETNQVKVLTLLAPLVTKLGISLSGL